MKKIVFALITSVSFHLVCAADFNFDTEGTAVQKELKAYLDDKNSAYAESREYTSSYCADMHKLLPGLVYSHKKFVDLGYPHVFTGSDYYKKMHRAFALDGLFGPKGFFMEEAHFPVLSSMINTLAARFFPNRCRVLPVVLCDDNCGESVCYDSTLYFLRIGQKMINRLNDGEIYALLAHEIGHIAKGHLPLRQEMQVKMPRRKISKKRAILLALVIATLTGMYRKRVSPPMAIRSLWRNKSDIAISSLVGVVASFLGMHGYRKLYNRYFSNRLTSKAYYKVLQDQEKEADLFAHEVAPDHTVSLQKKLYTCEQKLINDDFYRLGKRIDSFIDVLPASAIDFLQTQKEQKRLDVFNGIRGVHSTHPTMTDRLETTRQTEILKEAKKRQAQPVTDKESV